MVDKGGTAGDEPLTDGMALSVRLRRDFTVTDADRLLTAARRIYREINPGTTADEATEMVTCAADALFVILEQAGLFGDATDGRLSGYTADGLAIGGWRAQVIPNEPAPCHPSPRATVFAVTSSRFPTTEHSRPRGQKGPVVNHRTRSRYSPPRRQAHAFDRHRR
ncbi:hypothetical protein BZB76_1361 [Actinomadura pelletieri DSM 43383]|uniref:Uncharacterized protein n=1 Tax=Actinomadura pelletieri DSM 43383 TaxID=1120940 RepID=A0A495R0R8_9ACTN|nr:hypothetical protein [Actinomadura pelletieri]RKS79882.1 hypothetical protein BZB76_1361 [Actinomadura pelletieri DSM 43383]